MSNAKVYDIVELEYKNTSHKKAPLEYFIIPYKNNKHILYFPRKGIVALINDEFKSKIKTNEPIVKKMFEFAEKQPTIETAPKKTEEMVIELTTACNLNCIYCYANGGDDPKYIDWKTAKAAIDYQISKCNNKKFTIQFHGGGEPLLAFPMMKRCYEYAKEKCNRKRIKLIVNCVTNGTLVTEDVAKWFKKVGMDVLLSFDGLSEIQNMQRPFRNGNPSNDSIEKTIKLFNKYKIKYYTQAIITNYSINKMTDIIKNLYRLGVKDCVFGNIQNLGRCSKNHIKTSFDNSYEDKLKEAIKLAKKYGVACNAKEENEIFLPVNITCIGCGYVFVITARKNITSCLAITDPSDPAHKVFCYGKIKNGKVIIDKKKLVYIKNMRFDKMEKCNNCFAKYFCRGGCPAEAIRNNKSSFKQTKQNCIKNKAKTIKILRNILKK